MPPSVTVLERRFPVDVVYAHGDRAVPVGYGGYSSVGGVGVRRDFRSRTCRFQVRHVPHGSGGRRFA